MRKLLAAAAVLVVAGVVGWTAIGPDWRMLLANPPLDRDLLFWSTAQRDAGFRMLDRVPIMSRSRKIAAGDAVRELSAGAPLDLSSVDFDIDAYINDARVAGLVILQGGEVRLERYGLGFGPEGRWTSHSVAKSVTSTLVGAAVRDGFIDSLDAPVSKYVAGLKGSAYDDVTIEQLMTMTSGVAWNEDYDDPQSDVSQFLSQKPEGDEAAIVSYMKKLPRAHPPGEKWNYSTGETNLIGIVVAEAVGKPLADYASEKLWAPFGMEADATWLLAEDGREISGCCVQARTRDYARIGLFALEGGAGVVPDDWFARAATTRVDYGSPGEGYGYQWWTLDDGAFRAFGIFGQAIFIDPSRDLVIAMNSNWTSALGRKDGERGKRKAFFEAVRAAVDAEAETVASR